MTDVHSKETRSYNMSRIRSRDTKPELLVRKFLFSKGFRYRLHQKKLPGKPDIVLPKYKTVIFVHGCFWHSHNGCSRSVTPKSNQSYWMPKIERNAKRDVDNAFLLKKMGWRIIVIWECELKTRFIENTFSGLLDKLSSNQS